MFSTKILRAGIVQQNELAETVVLPDAKLEYNDSFILTKPNKDRLTITADVQFNNIAQQRTVVVDSETFHEEVAAACTFVYSDDINKLKQAGLIKGGSLDNAIVLDNSGEAINPQKLTYGDDIVRHKILDTIGDFAVYGKRITGDVFISRPGHTVNIHFIKELMRMADDN